MAEKDPACILTKYIPGPAASPVRLFQIDDRNYRFENARGDESKAPGWAEMDDGKGKIAIALRDFWQQWPKSIEVDSEGLAIGLFPDFEKGTFDHPGFLRFAASSGMIKIWERRGPPDFCNKDSGEWRCNSFARQ